MDAQWHWNRKGHFSPNNFGQKLFWRFQLYCMLDIIPSSNLVQYQGNIVMQPWENSKNPNLDPVWVPWSFFHVLPLLVVWQCSKLSSYAISRKTNWPNFKKNDKKPNFGLDVGPFSPNLGQQSFFAGFTFTSN